MCMGGLFANANLLTTLNHLIYFLYLDSLSYFNICFLMLLD